MLDPELDTVLIPPGRMLCVECTKLFHRKGTRRIVCSDQCAVAHRQKQFDQYNARKKQHRAATPREPRQCKICTKLFTPTSNNQVYCTDEKCKRAGLEQAIERQRQRREAAKNAVQ